MKKDKKCNICNKCGCLIGEGGEKPYILTLHYIDNSRDEVWDEFYLKYNYYCKLHLHNKIYDDNETKTIII